MSISIATKGIISPTSSMPVAPVYFVGQLEAEIMDVLVYQS